MEVRGVIWTDGVWNQPAAKGSSLGNMGIFNKAKLCAKQVQHYVLYPEVEMVFYSPPLFKVEHRSLKKTFFACENSLSGSAWFISWHMAFWLFQRWSLCLYSKHGMLVFHLLKSRNIFHHGAFNHLSSSLFLAPCPNTFQLQGAMKPKRVKFPQSV